MATKFRLFKKKEKENNFETEHTCKNCDFVFRGNYCPDCGQSIKEFERPIRFMFVDFVGTVVAFDTRMLHSLKAILFKPGKLTIDYMAGRRARYMPPFRFYVFMSFVMFLLLNAITNRSIRESMEENKTAENVAVIDSVKKEQSSNELVLFNNESELKNLDWSEIVKVYDDDGNKVQVEGLDSLSNAEDSELEKKILVQMKKISQYPDMYMAKVLQYTSWSLFLFMPIFAFLLWLVFKKYKPLYIYHFLFSLNVHSFLFLVLSLILVLNLLMPNKAVYPELWLLVLPAIYQVIGERKIFHNSWRKTIVKSVFVWAMYGFVWTMGITALFILSLVMV